MSEKSQLSGTYDFSKRVQDARRHWEKKFELLVTKGLEKELAEIYFEITNVQKEAIKITFASEEILNSFKKFQQQDDMAKLKRIVNPRFFKILGRSIITAGEHGLSLFSNILSLVYMELEQRIELRKERFTRARKSLYPKIKEIIESTKCCKGISVKIKRDGTSLYSTKLSVDIKVQVKPFDGRAAFPMHLTFKSSKSEEIIENVENLAKNMTASS